MSSETRNAVLSCLLICGLLAISVPVASAPLGSGEPPPFPADLALTTAVARNMEYVGQIGGTTVAVAVSGDYAYLGEGPRLIILDVSDPASPLVVGQTEPFPGTVEGGTVAGNYAYVAANDGGLQVVNVSNPAAPAETGFCDTPGRASDVAVSGAYAYVAVDGGGLRVMNVSSPWAPYEIGAHGSPSAARGVAVEEQYVYVADYNTGLVILNVTTPAAPSLVASLDTPGSARDVDVVGAYAYIADYNGGLRVFDGSVPSSPDEVGFWDTDSPATQDVVVSGDYAYLADGSRGLSIVDVSNPTSPAKVGSVGTSGYVHGLAFSGSTAVSYTHLTLPTIYPV